MKRRDAIVAGTLGVLIAASALAYLYASDHREALFAVLAAEIAGGREASLPTAIALDVAWTEAALVVSLIELTSLFLLFPVLVGLAAGLHKVRAFESMLSRAQDYARRNPEVDVLALGGLTLMPFLPIGALTSVLIGELLRLPSRYLLPTLAAALVLANVTMAYATDRLISLFPRPELVAAIMAALVFVGAGIAWLAHRLAPRREDAKTP